MQARRNAQNTHTREKNEIMYEMRMFYFVILPCDPFFFFFVLHRMIMPTTTTQNNAYLYANCTPRVPKNSRKDNRQQTFCFSHNSAKHTSAQNDTKNMFLIKNLHILSPFPFATTSTTAYIHCEMKSDGETSISFFFYFVNSKTTAIKNSGMWLL